jgi:hypothetical protein
MEMTSRYDLDSELRLLRISRDFNEKYRRTVQSLGQKEAAITLLQEKITRERAILQNIELEITALADFPFAGPQRQRHEEGILLKAMQLGSYNTLQLHLEKHKELMSQNEYRDEKIAVQEGAAQYEFYKEKYKH